MKFTTVRNRKLFNSALGSALAVLCGLFLWKSPPGEAWVNTSYDYSFRFGARTVTNQVILILMDNEAFDYFRQDRGQPWDRGLHAMLLQRLATDNCSLVVFDSFFRSPHDPTKDEALAAAMRKQRLVVLMAEQAAVTHPTLIGAHPTLPAEPFLGAAGTNWGVAWLDPDLDLIVRRNWPFPSPGPYPSLHWTAARLAGAILDDKPQQRWLRYYEPNSSWTSLSYRFALTQPTNYFQDKIVFVGTQPKTSIPGDEPDEFRTPYTRWTGESSGGVQILATAFLNLMNGDWLRRPSAAIEALVLVAAGIGIGGVLCQFRLLPASVIGTAFALTITLTAVSWSHFTNYWFPWLVIAGGQMPCALAWAFVIRVFQVNELRSQLIQSSHRRGQTSTPQVVISPPFQQPDAPDYELLNPPFGHGAYGKVWLARNAVGQWQALKVIYLSSFAGNVEPYDREFNGIKRFKPVSEKHSGLLRVDFVSQRKPEGYFYYVMELGDPLEANWERKPSTYKPRDLVGERSRARGQKLPVRECVRIGIALSDTVEFLHRQGLIHRDIKPQNVIFVNNQPKLADVGLVAEIREDNQTRTYVGTPGYMPPPPESPGTRHADIYALGMMLYVLSTGSNPTFFPEIATTLANSTSLPEFLALNTVILKACQPDPAQRYTSASEMHSALLGLREKIGAAAKGEVSGPSQ